MGVKPNWRLLGQISLALTGVTLALCFSRPAGRPCVAIPGRRAPVTQGRAERGEKGGSWSLLGNGKVQRFDGLALRGFTTAVVARRGRHASVAGELLGGGEIHAGVEQVGNEATAHIMRRHMRDARLPGAFLEHVVDGDGAEAIAVHRPTPRHD